ncbi:MAG: tetratricopeptide repeat protein [candidate division Zixibacteria bacterium]|nr:tetratricopeptide repeat protein [candidate division Zixibacteria bacterium]
MKKKLALCFLVIIAFSFSLAQEDSSSGRDTAAFEDIHSPAEIMEILEKSALAYTLTELPDSLSEIIQREKTVLNNNYYIYYDEDGSARLANYQTDDSAVALLNQGDIMFAANHYDSAVVLYKQALGVDSNYFWTLTVIGHAYYFLGEFDSSKFYYETAIRKNFVDYNAHWFLADLLWKTGDTARALEEITTAHLLNVNHLNIKMRLQELRNLSSSPWKMWSFEPRYDISREGNKIIVKFDLEWLPYAIVKAAWKYEPGYCRQMAGEDYSEERLYINEEIEALNAWLTLKENSPDDLFYRVNEILEDGFLYSFLYYEIYAPYSPLILLKLPREEFNLLIEYVNRYH